MSNSQNKKIDVEFEQQNKSVDKVYQANLLLSIKISGDTKMKKRTRKKRKRVCPINLICWVVIPAVIVGMFLLDGLHFYTLNTERIIVLGVGVCVMLIPFFNEITVKNFSFKKEDKNK